MYTCTCVHIQLLQLLLNGFLYDECGFIVSPALLVELRDTLSNPFFFKIKLEPIKTEELIASTRPMMKSWLISTGGEVHETIPSERKSVCIIPQDEICYILYFQCIENKTKWRNTGIFVVHLIPSPNILSRTVKDKNHLHHVSVSLTVIEGIRISCWMSSNSPTAVNSFQIQSVWVWGELARWWHN